MLVGIMLTLDPHGNTHKLRVTVNEDEELHYRLTGMSGTGFSLNNLQVKGGLPDFADLTAASTMKTVQEALTRGVQRCQKITYAPRIRKDSPLMAQFLARAGEVS